MSYRRAEGDESVARHYTLLGAAAVLLVAAGTLVVRWLEDDWSWVDSFYFSVVAVTTVGFGDFAPTTDASKIFSVFYILIGVTIVATALNGRLRRSEQRIQTRVGARHSRGAENGRGSDRRSVLNGERSAGFEGQARDDGPGDR